MNVYTTVPIAVGRALGWAPRYRFGMHFSSFIHGLYTLHQRPLTFICPCLSLSLCVSLLVFDISVYAGRYSGRLCIIVIFVSFQCDGIVATF